jgi:Zn-dependent M32 family carboxypeptidase
MNTSEQLAAYYDRKKEQYQIECILALLNWDQRVFMPIQAADARAGQIEYLGLLLHRKTTDPDYMRLIDNLAEQLDSLPEDDRVNIRESKRVLDIERKLPEDFVAQVHQASALAYSAWAEARPADDFKAVQPHLEKIVDLSRRMCDLIGYDDNPYDVLLDQYEPGAKTAWVKPLLTRLADELTRIIPPITERFISSRASRSCATSTLARAIWSISTPRSSVASRRPGTGLLAIRATPRTGPGGNICSWRSMTTRAWATAR